MALVEAVGGRVDPRSREDLCLCLCSHERCARQLVRGWCQTWHIVQWAWEGPVLVQYVVETLEHRLGSMPFRYWGRAGRSPDGSGVFLCLLLVQTNPTGRGLLSTQVESALAAFCGGLVRVVPEEWEVASLFCCYEQLAEHAVPWVDSLSDGAYSLAFGDASLPLHLRAEILSHDRITSWFPRKVLL